MLVVPKFMNYERPDGYDPGTTAQVLVRQGVLKAFGEVAVNYEALSEYFENFKRPADKSTVVLYRSGKFGEGVLPKSVQHIPHLPFSNTFHVNTWRRFYYPPDISGVRRAGPADVMTLLTERMFNAVDVNTQGVEYYDCLKEHRSDISFTEFGLDPLRFIKNNIGL